MKKLQYGILFLGLCLLSSLGWSDTLRLRNGSTIIGRYAGGSDGQINFRVGSSTQRYNVEDVVSITFDTSGLSGGSDSGSGAPSDQYQPPPPQSQDQYQPPPPPSSQSQDQYQPPPPPQSQGQYQPPPPPSQAQDQYQPPPLPPPSSQDDSGFRRFSDAVTVPSGTRIVVRTIDPVDSDKNRVGDRFSATLEEPLYVNDLLVAPKGTNVFGRLEEVKQSGQLSGRSELRLALTGMTVNGRTVQLSTSDYQLAGKSRGGDTAKKVGGGAALGAIIGAIAGGGKGAAIGAGVGAGAGTAVQIVTHGDQVHVPSETVLEFTLNQPVTINRIR